MWSTGKEINLYRSKKKTHSMVISRVGGHFLGYFIKFYFSSASASSLDLLFL